MSSARLRDLADLAQVGSQRRALRRLLAGAAEHRADRGQDLAELVVQLARDLAQRRLARGDQLLRQLAPLVRERGEPREQPAVRANQVQARRDDRRQRRGEEPVDLALHLAVDVLHLLRRLLFGLVVLDEQPRHGGAERRLPRLQRQLDLRARLRLLSGARQREDAIDRVPELRERGWPGTGAAPASAAPAPPLPAAAVRRPDRARMRSNCVDQAVSG